MVNIYDIVLTTVQSPFGMVTVHESWVIALETTSSHLGHDMGTSQTIDILSGTSTHQPLVGLDKALPTKISEISEPF
jgi:hypothetical protein